MLNPLAGHGLGRRYDADADEEFRLTMAEMGGMGGPRKRSFRIFQDAPEISPVRTESPLEESTYVFKSGELMAAFADIVDYRFDFPTMLLRPFPPEAPANHASPTPTVKQASKRIFGKENGQPELPRHVEVRQTLPSANIYPPQVFYDPMFSNNFSNPLYDPYRHNPYARFLPYTQPFNSNSQNSKSPQEYTSTFQGSFKPINAPSLRSPSHQGYGSGPENDMGMGSRPSSGYSNNPLLGFAGSSSRPGSSHENNLIQGIPGGSSRPDSGRGASVGNGLRQGNATTESLHSPGLSYL
jgi:hypothetical protein